MKPTTLILLATMPALYAGPAEPAPIMTEAAPEPWIKPLIDIRARYEFADIHAPGLDSANAFTTRERLGLQTTEWNGFSALVEGEFSQAIVDNYNGGGGAPPVNPSRSLIADPETNELNQGYIQYAGYDMVAKLGRQRLIYDNAAFIGNVGWRQNEQTYDAITLSGSWIECMTLDYGYVAQVNRIFGSDANPNFDYVDSNTHLFNFSHTGIEDLTLGGYAYIMNFEDKPNWDNNTFGFTAAKSFAGLDFYGEVAWQDKASAASDEEAFYFHGTATKGLGSHSLTVGVESLDAGFKTPLATLHAFNGFADAFLLGRSEGTHNGLTDTYVSYSMPIFWGMKWINTAHAFGDNEISTGYGWEIDSVLVKKFNENFTAIAKLGYFDTEGDAYVGAAALPGTTRFSAEINYKF